MKNLLLLFIFLVFATNLNYSQVTIHVPADYPTIQAGIDAVVDGDIVLVAEGIYYENIKFNGKKILVASHFILDSNSIHIDNTIINGSQPTNPDYGSVVTFDNNEDTSSVICGFTITGGTGTIIPVGGTAGGGILATYGCTIIKNKITANFANNSVVGRYAFGGGIACILNNDMRILISDNDIYNNSVSSHTMSGGAGIGISAISDCLINDNRIHNNSVFVVDIHSRISGGGGIWSGGYNPEIKRNIIMNNFAPLGGAILSSGGNFGFSLRLINNTITENHALYQGGGLYLYVGYANTINNIIWGNTAPKDSNIFYRGYLDFDYSIINKQMTGTGNLQSDPMFIDTLYHLASNSPALDAGSPDVLFNDFEDPSSPGFALWPAQGTTRNDMGGYGATDSAHLLMTGFQMVDEFMPYSFPGLVYRIAYPSEYDSTQQYPLSIVLHGSGDVGTNNINQLWIGLAWRANAQAYGYNDFTVIPQSPTNPWSSTNLYNLIQHLINTLPIDTNRIVVTGWSMGGFAVGSILQQYPRSFAAGIPISGATWGTNLRNIPLWLLHGDNDNNVSVEVSRNVVRNLQQLGVPVLETKNITEIELDSAISSGAKFLYTEVSGSDHFIITRIYDNYCLFKWLSLTRRNSIFPDQVWTNPDGYVVPGNSTIIRGTFYNPNNYLADYRAVIENLETDTLQIIQLYDDGQHNDSLSNDGIWGNLSQVISDEQILRVGIEVFNSDLNELFYFRDMSRFTTAGPVVVDSIYITYNSILKVYYVKLFLKNEGNTFTIPNSTVQLSSDDLWITSISSALSLPEMLPGSIVSSGNFYVRVDSTFPGYFNFDFLISVGGLPCWTDSAQVTVTGIDDEIQVPLTFRLEQNYPNPLNPSTVISYQLPVSCDVLLKVYAILGNEIATLVDEYKPAGRYEIELVTQRYLPSGVYFYQLRAGELR